MATLNTLAEVGSNDLNAVLIHDGRVWVFWHRMHFIHTLHLICTRIIGMIKLRTITPLAICKLF
jgi:hypothetical protein